MADPRRRFNSREKQALWLAAGGCCESCGVELQQGWHADHVQPWSRNGKTDVINGAALCQRCNTTKGAKMDPRDAWQRRAVSQFVDKDYDFLVTACPGSGKTRMGLLAARTMIECGMITRVVVVTPRVAIKTQWVREAHAIGLDLTSIHDNRDGAMLAARQGAVITYHQAASDPELWRIISTRGHRTLVILDEVHHASEDADWGSKLLHAFGSTHRRLMLSGTPFRTDGTPIPFVTYDENGMAISHEGMSYGEAVADGLVRPVRFEAMDGGGSWLRGNRQRDAHTSYVSEEDVTNLLRTLYNPDGVWIHSILSAAHQELLRLRDEMPNAGGLIIAQTQDNAVAYAKLIEKITGEPATLVISDDERRSQDPSEAIDEFRRSKSCWIVAVDMISEGVDIPRLAVLVYATDKKTEMFFRQAVGRIVRRDGDTIMATMFIPNLRVWVEMAERIEAEATVGLMEAEFKAREVFDGQQRTFDFEIVDTTPLSSTDATRAGVIAKGETFTDDELRRAEQLLSQVGGSLSKVHAADLCMVLRLNQDSPAVTKVTATIPVPTVTSQELRNALRGRVNAEVARVVARTGDHFGAVHGSLNDQFGDTVPTASIETLEKRLEVLRSWL